MLQLLRKREYVAEDGVKMQNKIADLRARSLGLSVLRDVESKHNGGIVSLDLETTENRYLLSGGSDGQIGIYDMYPSVDRMDYTHRAVCFVDTEHDNVHRTSVSCVTWYPHDSGMFLSCGTDKILKVWDTNRLVAVEEYKFSGITYCVCMSGAAGSHSSHSLAAVTADKSEVVLVDLKSGSRSHTLRGHQGAVLCAQWSRGDEFIIATGGMDGRVLLWDIRKARPCILVLDKDNHRTVSSSVDSSHRAHHGRVNALHFTDDGRHLVTMGSDSRLRAWNAFTGRKRQVHFGHHENRSRRLVQVCSSGRALYAPESANIETYDLTSGQHVRTLMGHYTSANCCVFNQATNELYSGGNDRNILIFNADSEMEKTYVDHLEGEKTGDGPESSQFQDEWSSDSDDNYEPG